MDALFQFILRSTVNRFTSLHKRKILYMHVCPSPRGDVSKQGTIWNLNVSYPLPEKRRSTMLNGIYFENVRMYVCAK